MNAERVNAASGVILAAMQTRQTAAGIAAALEAACLLQSPQSADELLALKARVAELEDAAEAGTGSVDDDPIALVLTHCARCGKGLDDESISDFCSDRCESASKLATLLARQREDVHTSPLHHEYRIGRDLEASS